ncbi:hypothetical protein H0H81_008009 [Sphagnurus paluster]|uniref:Uncharacterized protein n=1 Tax=Sphagnurus paluster TaxID=117069 RepID=A0A9P7GJ69_9AGAR|nr:hypothetical protein H0H81_008009 [Sphagnurus paluster]
MRPPSFPSVASPSRLRAFHAKAYNTRPQRRRPDFIEELPNSALIRLHGHRLLDSPAEALALIRTVERKYGAIREYRFLKDFEVQSYYQVFVNVAFQDPKALARLPAKGETVNFTLPTTISNRPGGVGLDELEPFLAAQEFADSKVPSFDNVMGNVMENKKEEVIKFTIEATGTLSPRPTPSSRIHRRSVAM